MYSDMIPPRPVPGTGRRTTRTFRALSLSNPGAGRASLSVSLQNGPTGRNWVKSLDLPEFGVDHGSRCDRPRAGDSEAASGEIHRTVRSQGGVAGAECPRAPGGADR